ncbi:uncharacterized protein LOC128858984 [Anastrepha ludens]|uniref:uncharacterized protein LOC128858984 n=1 Tax=Anastrepha ludens TaxID=28586 RepID=UPI0023B00B3C|nr:uncharacterized protein LOC128858984 [Anastrepha ludens]
MAYHFSANQFEKAYSAKRLCNWELPKWYPPHPRKHKAPTKVIANTNGRLLNDIARTDKNPWGYFRSTYELPRKITRNFADEYNECLIRKHKWRNFPRKKSVCAKNDEPPKCEDKCETVRRIFSPGEQGIGKCAKGKEKKYFDLEYVSGDYTPYGAQHNSRAQLLQQKHERDNNFEPELPLDKLYLGDHLCRSEKPDVTLTRPLPLPLTRVSSPSAAKLTPKRTDAEPPALTVPQSDLMPPVQTETSLLPQTAALTDSVGPSLEYFKKKFGYQNPDSPTVQNLEQKMPLNSITVKPNERSPSPVIPAYANFELAKRMHHDNLDHQPLPDCVVDMAFRKRQMTGEHPGLALDISPFATGVGIRTHNAGPTHCTKMKVFRPRTCGVVPKAYNGDLSRAISSAQSQHKPMTAMDLAIGWDYRPANPANEPQPPPHIDGSDDTAGPAVFNYVKTPRDETTTDLGRSAGVFNSTLGETGFFDKDIIRRKSDFGDRITERGADCLCNTDDCVARAPRARSMTRNCTMPTNRLCKQYQSSPNMLVDEGYRALRQKYLGGSGGGVTGSCEALIPERGCRRSKANAGAAGFLRRARSRLCHKVAPEPPHCYHAAPARAVCKAPPFRVGVPKYDAAGYFVSTDSGCSMEANNASRVLVVPRQRDPYAKRNYDIDTLVPPFRSFGGGAGEGGYPEHWRLASVYQHAYKPLEQRRRPLLQTVYK